MAAKKKLSAPITLFAAIEASQHEALRTLAFQEHRSIADVVREAIDLYIHEHKSRDAKPRKSTKRAATG
jgi:hypothetical protein